MPQMLQERVASRRARAASPCWVSRPSAVGCDSSFITEDAREYWYDDGASRRDPRMLFERPSLAAAQSRVHKWVKDTHEQRFGLVVAVVEDDQGRIRMLTMFRGEREPRQIALEPVVDGHYMTPEDNQSRYRPLSDNDLAYLRKLAHRKERPEPVPGRIELRVRGSLSAAGTLVTGEAAVAELGDRVIRAVAVAYDDVLVAEGIDEPVVTPAHARAEWPAPRTWSIGGWAAAWLPRDRACAVLERIADRIASALTSDDEPGRWLVPAATPRKPLSKDATWRLELEVPDVWQGERKGVVRVGLRQ